MEFRLKIFQDKFMFSQARFPCFCAAVGTGKTLVGILRMVKLMEESPNNLGLIIRREFVDLQKSTIKDFENYTGLTVGTNKEIKFPNGSIIIFLHGKELGSNVIKNINAGAIFVEQAEEFETDEQFQFLRDRLRRKEAKFRTLFITANTNGHNWIWRFWKNNPQKEYELAEATTFDNQDNLPKDFIEDLKTMKEQAPHHYNRYVLNSWEDTDTVDNVIQHTWVMEAIKRKLPQLPNKRIVVCDPARYGDDETVIYGMLGTSIKEIEIYRQKSTMETAGRLLLMKDKMKANMIAVGAGMGEGIVDRIRELARVDIATGKLTVMLIKGGEKSEKPDKFRNLKSQIWWEAGEAFQSNIPLIPNDPILHEQLTTPRYKVYSDKLIQVETKEEIRKRLGGSSPDRGDTLVMGLYALKKAKPVTLGQHLSIKVPEAVSPAARW